MKRRILFLTLAGIGIAGTIIVVRAATNDPPLEEIEEARKLVSDAKLAGAEGYGGDRYNYALCYYDSAMEAWSRENGRFFLFRNYDRTGEMAKASSEYARRAMETAHRNIYLAKELMEKRVKSVGALLERYDALYDRFPHDADLSKELTRCKIRYGEASRAFSQRNYSICKSRLDAVEPVLEKEIEKLEARVTGYMANYPKWKELEEQSINYSRKNRVYTLVVDKVARECVVYKDGKAFAAYDIELGPNWVGEKIQQGDRRTPEGRYTVTMKKSGGQTRYYKALLIDYPNDDDRRRFDRNRQQGVLGPDARIGGFIEIHGHGGKGADWTDGCVALSDADMDELFRICATGTRVTIVGSTRPLDELLK